MGAGNRPPVRAGAWLEDSGGLSGGRRIAKTVGDNTTKYCYDANTVQTYEYSVYGHVLGVEGAGHPNPYLFTARRLDSETGLYYFRARYYNPDIGRFLQTDPVGYRAGMNLYSYCLNNPIVRVDPSGCIMGKYPVPYAAPTAEQVAAVVNAIGAGAGYLHDRILPGSKEIAEGATLITGAMVICDLPDVSGGAAMMAVAMVFTGAQKVSMGTGMVVAGICGIDPKALPPGTTAHQLTAWAIWGEDGAKWAKWIEEILLDPTRWIDEMDKAMWALLQYIKLAEALAEFLEEYEIPDDPYYDDPSRGSPYYPDSNDNDSNDANRPSAQTMRSSRCYALSGENRSAPIPTYLGEQHRRGAGAPNPKATYCRLSWPHAISVKPKEPVYTLSRAC